MCGIVAGVASRDVATILLDGLRRLAYRGYDSAGIAVINKDKLQRIRVEGKVAKLADKLAENPLSGTAGIAHTRWATHGKPSKANAHPHISGQQVALVHNGIIENYQPLRDQLIADGYILGSDTDTEVVVHLLHQQLSQGLNFLSATLTVVKQLQGAYAFAIGYSQAPDRIIGVRKGSPLVVGIGDGEIFIASDSLALAEVAEKFIYLEEGDVVDIQSQQYQIYDMSGEPVTREIKRVQHSNAMVGRGRYRHFMLKEIFEQPEALAATLEGRVSFNSLFPEIFGDNAVEIFKNTAHVQIIACGTSYHAGLVASYWLEALAGISCDVDIASEFRYRQKVVPDNTLFVTISQSGETADTLAALELAKALGYSASLAICNVPESTLVRGSDLAFMTRAGVEVGVASTKAFTTQLVALLMLTVAIGKGRTLSAEREAQIVAALQSLPQLVNKTLAMNQTIQKMALDFTDKDNALFLGRGVSYPIALEGALKLKEISYIHAEAYPAGELKHGPLALVDRKMPVIAVAPNDQLLEKLKSNLQEVRARGGELFVFADTDAQLSDGEGLHVYQIPQVDPILIPIIYTIPLQLLAYHVAIIKGTDVDQPRNLAKSVTVE